MAKICIFSAQYLPHLGGVENYTYNLSKQLIQRGHEVVIVTSNVQRISSYEIMKGIPVYRMPCINLLNGRYPVLKFNKQFREINKKLKKEKFDFVIINTRFYIHSLYGARLAKKKRIKGIVIDHGTSHLTVHNTMLDAIGNVFEHFITKILQCYNKSYYGVSKASNEWLKHFHIQAKSTLYNAIDLEKINNLLLQETISYRKIHNIPSNAIVITFTGRLLKEKGLLTLIDAVEKLLLVDNNIYLIIAGDGDLMNEVMTKKSNHIIPVGRLTFEEVIALLKDSDIFCLPSDSEGFSTSLLEAAACHNYIVTTKRGGARELLLNDDYGIVIDNNDFHSVYEALDRAISNQDIRDRATKLTYDWLIDNFTWEITTNKVEELINEE